MKGHIGNDPVIIFYFIFIKMMKKPKNEEYVLNLTLEFLFFFSNKEF